MKTYNVNFSNFDDLNTFFNLNKDIKYSKSLLVQIFSGKIDEKLLLDISKYILKEVPNANIIGATTDGEILEGEVITHSIVLSFSIFEKSSVVIDYVDNIDSSQSYEAGKKIAVKLKKENSKVFILFGDGLNINGEELLNGVKKKAPNIIVSGGLSGDNATFEGTYIIYQDKVIQHAVVGVSLNSDDLIVNNGYSFAWQNIGRKFTVNRSTKGVVYEIDGMTPVELYAKYLGQEVADLLPGIGIEFPLIIQDGDIDVARAVLARNDDDSLVFAGNVNEGAIVRFGVGNASELLGDAFNLAYDTLNKKSESLFIYSCMARRRFLDTQASIDVQNFSKICNVAGFFTYGEFFTFENEYKLLNETLTILSLSESSDISNNIELKNEHQNVSSVTTLQALSHLVNVSSHELEAANENLEEKISFEIEKNLENEKKLFDSMKMSSLGDMIANIAHQWRQPLSVITTSASGMQVQHDLGILDDTAFKKYTDSMVQQAMYLSDTINTFRDFIKEDYVLADVVLQDDIDKTLKLLDVVLKDNNIQLYNNIDYTTPITLSLITGELSHVNIFNNSKDALVENDILEKWIKLSLEFDDNNCMITIEDNAGGIPEDVLPKIFEPYFTTKHQTTGTGIGLYMSYDIVTKHFGGKLYTKNTENGAKFYIEIPKSK